MEVTQEKFTTNYKDTGGLKFFLNMTIKRDGKLFIEEEFTDQRALERLGAKHFAKPSS
jgi:hypothetical protein